MYIITKYSVCGYAKLVTISYFQQMMQHYWKEGDGNSR